jgi:hypothetical protein
MSGTDLTCEETPLAWPAGISIEDLMVCSTCGIKIHSPNPGTLQILTRRQGADGVGDGVNIEEDSGIGADYRGQRYSIQEAIFHVPGLHVFPGEDKVYPAEYHVHMTTYSKPQRSITLVIPVSHLVPGEGEEYFAAFSARLDPSKVRPRFDSILTPGTKMLQYQGPDIRGHTKEVATEACDSLAEWQYLLVLKPVHIRAADLERIPREGSLSTDPRDLPAPGVEPSKQIPRDRLLLRVVMANPGILGPEPVEAEKVVEGFESPKPTQLIVSQPTAAQPPAPPKHSSSEKATFSVLFALGLFVGILLADSFINFFLWGYLFKNARASKWEPMKVIFILTTVILAGFSYDISIIPKTIKWIWLKLGTPG